MSPIWAESHGEGKRNLSETDECFVGVVLHIRRVDNNKNTITTDVLDG